MHELRQLHCLISAPTHRKKRVGTAWLARQARQDPSFKHPRTALLQLGDQQSQQKQKKSFKPRFKIDHAASPMPETNRPERLAPRATSNRNGGRDHLGIPGEIKSVHPGDFVGIRRPPN
jgi:hypothetical protein